MNKKELSAAELTFLKGIGPGRAELFFAQGVRNLWDLLEYFPRNYLDERARTPIGNVRDQELVLLRARVCAPVRNFHARRMTITSTRIADETGQIEAVWYNQPYLVKNLQEGKVYLFEGKVKFSRGRLSLNAAKVMPVKDEMPGIVPVYPLGGGLTQKIVSAAVKGALELLSPEFDPLPMHYRQNLMDFSKAYEQIHFPASFEEMEKARKRLVFDELFIQQLALRSQKLSRQENQGGVVMNPPENWQDALLSSLPYPLTGAQAKVIQEICRDLSDVRPMNRLLQGDVGSGKTMVAFFSVYAAFLCGYQSALMAPTEVLARQHFKEASRVLEPLGVRTALLTGTVTGKERQTLLEKLKNGEIDFLIGTHALIQDPVVFYRPGLVITDEQHRFGVRQRWMLAQKDGEQEGLVNVLVMTATPIPRTLAMILYGDMDISVLDEMPPGRTPVKTYSVNTSYDERLYQFIRRQVEEGHQVYVICPMVEEAEETEMEDDQPPLRSAVGYQAYLSEMIFPDIPVGLLHGQMKNAEKDAQMTAFARGETKILVSTTVVEVGVNVPNATLMIVENAERFGLSQLHQLRGRVGRGRDESYCVLVSDQKKAEGSLRFNGWFLHRRGRSEASGRRRCFRVEAAWSAGV
ncbi:MAG: ATP-dependent DNA helicase RecG [Firmicutes bacterium]|nr:ATP-dependent DNA helicase RecG [Bacillota bacterium]